VTHFFVNVSTEPTYIAVSFKSDNLACALIYVPEHGIMNMYGGSGGETPHTLSVDRLYIPVFQLRGEAM
jgi:hypothetical protein